MSSPVVPLPSGLVHVRVAEETARSYLAEALPRRWRHTVGVAARAGALADAVGLDGDDRVLLMNAAWFHDIGYAVRFQYNWHPLAGAALLRSWEMPRVASLVAWHTTAAEEAALLGEMQEDLLSSYPRPEGVVADLLTYADMMCGPDGEPLTMHQRLVEIRRRHGQDSTAAVAMTHAWPRLLAVRDRVEYLLAN